MPVTWSSGWLLEQMVALDTDPEAWWKKGVPLSLYDPDPDEDPWHSPSGPPPGYQRLPWHEEEEL